MNLIKFFKSPKIIHCRQWQPGVFIKRFRYTANNEIYIRIGFPNRQKYAGLMPITDVLYKDVTAIERKPSQFKRWRMKLVGKKAKSKIYIIKHKK
jgi:hypothetical protein